MTFICKCCFIKWQTVLKTMIGVLYYFILLNTVSHKIKMWMFSVNNTRLFMIEFLLCIANKFVLCYDKANL